VTSPVAAYTVLDVIRDLLSSSFTGPSCEAWRAVLAALFVLPMSETPRPNYIAVAQGAQSLLLAPLGRHG
jgi:hypothetical protein